MSLISEMLDRLSGMAMLKDRLTETSRSVDRSLAWLLDHEKRLIRLEMTGQVSGERAAPAPPRLPRGK